MRTHTNVWHKVFSRTNYKPFMLQSRSFIRLQRVSKKRERERNESNERDTRERERPTQEQDLGSLRRWRSFGILLECVCEAATGGLNCHLRIWAARLNVTWVEHHTVSRFLREMRLDCCSLDVGYEEEAAVLLLKRSLCCCCYWTTQEAGLRNLRLKSVFAAAM